MKYNFYPFNGKGDYELALVKNNKAVTKLNTTYHRAPYNGYVVFPAKDIPKDWWGNDSAGALQYLDIHGGITFCECEVNDIKTHKEIIKDTKKEIEKIKANKKDYEGYMEKFQKQQKVRLKANQKKAKLEDSYVVFGFDCAHSGDDDNRLLYDKEHVMLLVEKMERQLMDYAKIYDKWKEMDRENQVKAIEYITGERDMENIGFGAMIDMLAGGTSFKKEE